MMGSAIIARTSSKQYFPYAPESKTLCESVFKWEGKALVLDMYTAFYDGIKNKKTHRTLSSTPYQSTIIWDY